MRVLIVEDNDFSVLPIMATLKKHNIQYDVAKNGFMAVERYKKTSSAGYRHH